MDAEKILKEGEIIDKKQNNENNDKGTAPLDNNNEHNEVKSERLSAIIAGGKSKQYLGKDLQTSDIDTMSPEQINKLYGRYEARLGASMTKTLGNSFINLYVMGVSKYFKVIDPSKLIEELEEDPFVNHALTGTCCELYYRFGMFMAPLTAGLTTLKHVDFTLPVEKSEKGTAPLENITLENDE